MAETITVVVIRSLSYTGTTWLSLVLGSHPRAFALGPPDQAWNQRHEGWPDRCRVHGTECELWPRFHQTYDPNRNFYVQLAEVSGRSVIVTNNPLPDGAGSDLEHKDLDVRNIHVIRDGRAVAASYHRKHPDTSFYDVMHKWLRPSFTAFPFDPHDPDRLCLRYEDVLADQRGHLQRFSDFVGLDYGEEALRFWEHDHHPSSGNAGTVMMVRLAQGLPVPGNVQGGFYEDQLRRLIEDPTLSFEDERWREELTTRERFVFDYFCGADNERHGYERDRFTTDEMQQLSGELGLALENDLPVVESLLGRVKRKLVG
jgi:hypothetical protein